jgi:hypothetical protein
VDATAGWKSLNNGLGITQFYAAAGSLATRRVLAGAQDNGTVLYTPPPGPNTALDWRQTRKGDGGYCAYDQVDPRLVYFEYIYAEVFRSITGGECTTDSITGPSTHSGVTEVGRGRAPFIAPFLLDPADPRIMLLGSQSVYRSMDVRAATPTFAVIKPPQAHTFVSALAARRLAPPPGPSDDLWVGHSDGAIFRARDGDQVNPTWEVINGPGSPLPKFRRCTRIVLDPADVRRVFACFGGYFTDNLWRSTDGGANWEPLGQANALAGPEVLKNLPDVSVYDLAIHPDRPQIVYLATEIGIFASGDGGTTWAPTRLGPANVATHQLFWLDRILIAVTHGRGVFWIDLALKPAAVARGGGQPRPGGR